MKSFKERVWKACKLIPRGRVSTYGEIAHALKMPGASRAVGNALNANRSARVPCHRVVKSNGELGGFALGPRNKRKKLEAEGVRIAKGRAADFAKKFKKLSN